ncbi:DNA-binding GntR family transcriptional regulator [Bradyrhizobium sp. LB8.2]|uniref:GntR family transcriptional regulator n=1 Tax=unclassified Bradyrhizobium TaxID=2631580 RepID=UPI0033996848
MGKSGKIEMTGKQNNSVVRYAPMHDQILPHLRKDIIENRWKSGERLSEPLLCKEFGVSRTPLRQALTTLELEGLVRLIPHVGAVVTDPDEAQVGEHMEVLIALEQLAATRVAEAGKPEVLRDIQKIQREMNSAAKSGDAARYYTLNDAFHLAIVHGTGNRALMDLHEKVMWHVHRERHRVNFGESVTTNSASSHTDLLKAILKGQPDVAGLAMRVHLEHVGELMLAHRQALTIATKPVKGQASQTGHGARGKPAARAVPRASRGDTI